MKVMADIMPTVKATAKSKTAAKKTAKTAKKSAPKTAKKVTREDVWETINEIGKALKETQRIVGGLSDSHAETEKAMRETQRIVGDLGNKFGDEAEYTMIPGLPEKFRQFGFDFDSISRNKKKNNKKQDIHAEIDAFLENGTQAMAVEVKAKLKTTDVDDHVKRMEKLRKHADLFGDRRELFGALAATIVEEKPKNHALKNGFYVIEPSGEDVKIIKPESNPKIW
jgi:hypothetical protein